MPGTHGSTGAGLTKLPTKKSWSPEEDAQLIALIEKHGTKNWSNIAQFLPSRIGKQCRERWYNHLDPNIKKGDWTEEEDEIIITQQRLHGNQWSLITKLLPGRTDNSVKNRWHATARARNRSDSMGTDCSFMKSVRAEEEEDSDDGKVLDTHVVVDNVFPVFETVSPQVAADYYSDSDLYLETEPPAKESSSFIGMVRSPKTKSGRMSASSHGSGVGWLVYANGKTGDEFLSPTADWTDAFVADGVVMDCDSSAAVPEMSNLPEASVFNECFPRSESFMMLCPSPRNLGSEPLIHIKRHIFSPDMLLESELIGDADGSSQPMEMCFSPTLGRITIYSPDTMISRDIQFDQLL